MFQGSMVALVTPMGDNAEVDIEALRNLVNFHIDNETQGIVAAGTTAESGTLTQAEKQLVIETVIDEVKGRIPVIAGTGANSTDATIKQTEHGLEMGADGCLVMTPAYIKPTQAGLVQHYSAIAKAVGIPIIPYNVPGRTACDMLPETIARLAHFSNIVAVKEASGDVKRTQAILELTDGQIDVLSGEDDLTASIINSGGKGVISVYANVVPALSQQLCQAALARNHSAVKRIEEKLQPLAKALFLESNPIPVKWALYKMGLISSSIRAPLTVLSESYQTQVIDALAGAGVNV